VASVIDTVVNLAKRRGLVYPAGEIYGGTKSAWDYGPLGVELKENIKRQWWRSVVTGRDDVVGLDSSIILPREVWVASGHVEVFHDPLVESLITHKRYRADHLIEAYEAKHGHPPPNGLADIRDILSAPGPERRAALRSALSVHAERATLHVLDPSAFDAPSTKQAAELLHAHRGGRVLVALHDEEFMAAKSFRNLVRVNVLHVDDVGVADLVRAATLVVSQAALDALTTRARKEAKS